MRKNSLAARGALVALALAAPILAVAEAPGHAPLILAQAQAQPTSQQRVEMLKQWLQASEMQVRKYEWIETTTVSKDGQQKSNTQKRCYYGADGKMQKVVLNQQSAPPPSTPPGPLGRRAKQAAEEKKGEMTDYMHKAVELVHSYVPPIPGLIQQSMNGGKFGAQVLEPNRRVRLNFGDYLKPGDSLGVEIDTTTNRLLGLSVASYLDSPKDAIALNVSMSVLQDGTIFAARTDLEAKALGLKVTVENSGHRRIAP